MKKFIVSSVLASSLVFPGMVHAANLSFPLKVTADKKVELYKGATNFYPVMAVLNPGQQVTVTDEFTNSSGEVWYHVNLGTAKGWGISTSFTGIMALNSNYTVNRSNINFRKGASTAYPIIGTLAKGATVKVIDSFKNSAGEQWYRIKYGNQTGWVLSSLLNPTTSTVSAQPSATKKTVYASSAIIRKGATTSYEKIGTLTKNQQVTLLDTYTNSLHETWYKIQSGNLKGWVISTAFEKTVASNNGTGTSTAPTEPSASSDPAGTTEPSAPSAPTQPANPQAPAVQSLIVGTHNTYLYAGATTSYKKLEQIPFISTVTVLGQHVNASNETWINIKTSSGKTGWTPKSDLVTSTSDLTYLYAENNAVVRKGASANYAVSVNLKANDKLLVLQELNGWVNVETDSGTRGWVLKTQTSPVSVQQFISPTTFQDSADSNINYLVWQKPSDFDFTYSASSNQLILSQGITNVELPSFNVKGIQSITSSGTTSKKVTITFQPGYTFTIRNDSDKVSIKVMPTGLSGKRIIIDAGHGGNDPGAIGPDGVREKDVNLAVALLVKSELEKAGAIVTLTRSTDVFLELSERTAIANSSNADAFISIHCDSYSKTSKGTTTYYNTSVNFNGPESVSLGQDIEKQVTASLGTYNKGTQEQEFYVNRMNELPSVLVELAYISNPNEEALLNTVAFRQKAAIGIKDGLEAFFSNK